jgi:bifunctional ADP-heptose synthase (sugar kinase/adenylyltransferase)
MLTTETIDRILDRLPTLTIGVLGDLFLDRYLDLDAALTEPSIETGLDAYQVVNVRSYPGAAGTIVNNLVAIGVGRVVPVTIIGDDGEGYELRRALDRMPTVDTTAVLSAFGRRTPTYTKPMLRTADQPPRELNRLDIKNRDPTPPEVVERLLDHFHPRWHEMDALIVLDQVSEPDCGAVTDRVRDEIEFLGAGCPSRFILADSRERIDRFRGMAIKPNLAECLRALDVADAAGPPEWERHLRSLADKLNRPIFCTRGELGILLAQPAADITTIPSYPVTGPTDPVGAGDSTSAGIACAVAAGATFAEAAAFGNLVASVTVQQIGITGTATPRQVRQRWLDVKDGPRKDH